LFARFLVNRHLYEKPNVLSFANEQVPIYQEPCEQAPMGEVHYLAEPGVVDISIIGKVYAPRAIPVSTMEVKLQWGNQSRVIRVFGKRVWRKEKLRDRFFPTEPEYFTELPMSWKLAYGGKHMILAGFVAGTQIPMPSSEYSFPANPEGIGFYTDMKQVEGSPLPHFEDPEHLINSWQDQPTPVCFAPCPMQSALRMQHIDMDLEHSQLRSKYGDEETLFGRFMQNAPPSLQTKSLIAGIPFRLEGMMPNLSFAFSLPAPPIQWIVHTAEFVDTVVPEYAAVQFLTEKYKVTVLFQAQVYYPLIQYETRKAKLVFLKENLTSSRLLQEV